MVVFSNMVHSLKRAESGSVEQTVRTLGRFTEPWADANNGLPNVVRGRRCRATLGEAAYSVCGTFGVASTLAVAARSAPRRWLCCVALALGLVLDGSAVSAQSFGIVHFDGATVSESSGSVEFEVSSSHLTGLVTLECRANLGAGTVEAEDFTIVDGVRRLRSGVSVDPDAPDTTCSLGLLNDTLVEPDEILVVELVVPGETAAEDRVVDDIRTTITSDDVLTVTTDGDTNNNYMVTEGQEVDTFNMRVTMKRPAGSMIEFGETLVAIVTITGEVESTDFRGDTVVFPERSTTGMAIFSPDFTGDATPEEEVRIAIEDDDEDEADESFTFTISVPAEWQRALSLSSTTIADAAGVLQDNDDDTTTTIVSITSGNAEAREADAGLRRDGEPATVVLGLAKPAPAGGVTIPLTFTYGNGGTAADFTVSGEVTTSDGNHSITFPADSTRVSFTVSAAKEDNIWKPPSAQSATMTVSLPVSTDPPTGIVWDDDAPDQSVIITLAEGDDPPQLVLSLSPEPSLPFSEASGSGYTRRISMTIPDDSTVFASARGVRLVLVAEHSAGSITGAARDLAFTGFQPSDNLDVANAMAAGSRGPFTDLWEFSIVDDNVGEHPERILVTVEVLGDQGDLVTDINLLNLGLLVDNELPTDGITNVNYDRVTDEVDAQIMYYSFALAEVVGVGTAGSGVAGLRQVLLSDLVGDGGATDDARLVDMVARARRWKREGVVLGGDLNRDGSIDRSDAIILYYTYSLRDLLGDGSSASQGTADFRRTFLGGHTRATDDQGLLELLQRANGLVR